MIQRPVQYCNHAKRSCGSQVKHFIAHALRRRLKASINSPIPIEYLFASPLASRASDLLPVAVDEGLEVAEAVLSAGHDFQVFDSVAVADVVPFPIAAEAVDIE